MAGRVVLYCAFAFFGVIAFLATTSDASSRTGECTAVSTALLSGFADVGARIDATDKTDPVKGVAGLLEVAAAYDRLMGDLQRLKIGAADVKNARGDLVRTTDQLHGWLVSYAQAVQKGEIQNLKSYRGNVEAARREVDENVKRLQGICSP